MTVHVTQGRWVVTSSSFTRCLVYILYILVYILYGIILK